MSYIVVCFPVDVVLTCGYSEWSNLSKLNLNMSYIVYIIKGDSDVFLGIM